tara:strand:- start:1078 stop:1569 length:492 start_codon:yes stop_codon:yes gene_type:complete
MNTQELFDKAIELEENDKKLEAIQILKKLYKNDDDGIHLLVKIAVNYFELGQYDHFKSYAFKYLDAVGIEGKKEKNEESKNKFLWFFYHHLGIVYGNENELNEALKFFQKAIAIKNDPNSITYAGKCYLDLGYEKQAISFFKTAAKMGHGEAILALNTRGIDI